MTYLIYLPCLFGYLFGYLFWGGGGGGEGKGRVGKGRVFREEEGGYVWRRKFGV